jgi:hypothetical protein
MRIFSIESTDGMAGDANLNTCCIVAAEDIYAAIKLASEIITWDNEATISEMDMGVGLIMQITHCRKLHGIKLNTITVKLR